MQPVRKLLAILLALGAHAAWAAEAVADLPRFHQHGPELASSGQPRRAQFAAIAAAGYKAVLNVAAPSSNPDALRDEKQLVEAAGMAYHHVPISWDKPEVGQIVAAVRQLAQLRGQPVLVHCYLNARASLVAYLHRTTHEGASEPDERAMMLAIWRQNRGYAFEDLPEWQFALEDAVRQLRR